MAVKSKIIIFNESGKILRDYNFVHKNRKMEIGQRFCYLGIDISASGSFSHAKLNLKDKSMKALFPLVDLFPIISLRNYLKTHPF